MDIYFDNASTTFPKPKEVADSIYNYILNIGGNANRSNHTNSIESSRQLLKARENIADFFNFDKPSNVIFTSNITTSLNILIKGLLSKGDHVITSSMEHNSVLRPLHDCKNSLNIDLEIIKASKQGFIDANSIIKSIKSNTKLIVLSHASNVCGSIQNLKEIGLYCANSNIFFIIDSAQSAGSIDVDFKKLNANAIAFTGHKSLLGPQGIGGFILDDKLNEACSPILSGGTGSLSHSMEQPTFLPDKFECGTLNMPGIIGLSSAIDFINKEGLDTIHQKLAYLRKTLFEGLNDIDKITVYGKDKDSTSCISVNYQGVDPSELSYYLALNGIKTRSGLHCAPLAHETLNTYPSGTVRLSLSYFNSIEEIDYTLSILNKFQP